MTVTNTCPICGKPTDPKRAPFCSPRCADVDLNRWLKGAYGIPVVEMDDIDESEAGEAGADDGENPRTRH